MKYSNHSDSVFLQVCLALDRLLHMHWPLIERRWCSPFRARIVILGLTLVSTAVFLNMSLIYGAVEIGAGAVICAPVGSAHQTVRTLNQVDLFLNCVLPYVLLLAIFILGLVNTSKQRRQKRQYLPTRRLPKRVVIYEGSYEKGQNSGPLAFIGFYLLLSVPSQSFRTYMTILDIQGSHGPHRMPLKMILIQQTLLYVQYARCALNLLILISCSSGYRCASKAWLSGIAKVFYKYGFCGDYIQSPSKDVINADQDGNEDMGEINVIQEGTV